jgi:L-galactonate 5-dehydrogenase
MRALLINKPDSIGLIEKEKPATGEGEVLLKMNYVGFCGSDFSTYLGKNPMVQYPRIPGHEISAVIEESGPGVPKRLAEGDRVTVVPYTSCGNCSSCRRGRDYACQFNQTLGVQRDGAMQDYLVVPWQKVIKATSLGELELAMVEPLTVGFHAVERGRIRCSDVVAVLGCGMIGAGAIVRVSLIGATVIAVDIDDHKLDLARTLGAHHTINSAKTDLHEELQKLTNGGGPDVIIEAVGSPPTYLAAIEEVAFTGRIVCIGYAAQEIPIATKLFVQKEIDILGSRNAASDDFMAVISYLESGKFPVDRMITEKVRPEEAHASVKTWADDPGKVMKILLDLKS